MLQRGEFEVRDGPGGERRTLSCVVNTPRLSALQILHKLRVASRQLDNKDVPRRVKSLR